MDDMSRALINKITAEVYKNLREASRNGQKDLCEDIAELFGVEDNVPKYTYEKVEKKQQNEKFTV